MAGHRPIPKRFRPTNPEKYKGDLNAITMRSSWETRFAHWADINRAVIEWSSERVVVPYISPVDGRGHNYFIDFYIKVRTGEGKVKKYLIEIKPLKECNPPKPTRGRRNMQMVLQEEATYLVNQAKWEAARRFAKANECEFIVLTERELGLAK